MSKVLGFASGFLVMSVGVFVGVLMSVYAVNSGLVESIDPLPVETAETAPETVTDSSLVVTNGVPTLPLTQPDDVQPALGYRVVQNAYQPGGLNER